MSDGKADETRAVVREHYANVARSGTACGPACCGSIPAGSAASTLGYSTEDAASVPDGADLGLGCGNPTAIASLREGETVLDLGAGGGFDCFIAARQVGLTGRVIGVDMTPDMVSRARANARTINTTNVEFRLGEIEHLPVADASIDAILSNCVINLSPEKSTVFVAGRRVALATVHRESGISDRHRRRPAGRVHPDAAWASGPPGRGAFHVVVVSDRT